MVFWIYPLRHIEQNPEFAPVIRSETKLVKSVYKDTNLKGYDVVFS